ncbi:MAG: hypothetical protein ACQEXE_01590 [Bacillota bacterium]|uniref:hypothetical protein n=1 Tax=Cytobacillus firmus TaxID=1399 RepID=UPI0024C1A6D2|nr:hypothetical protein [Cytobacillus firmus]WHY35618.1 hypothetical protein QNH44_07715 [Cytobacillus firmus]
MKKNVILLFVWIIPLILAALGLVLNPNSFFVNGTILLGWILFAIQLSWNQSEMFYLKAKSIWFLIKNPDCIWNLNVEFTGQFDENIFSKLDNIFSSQPGDFKVIPLSNTRKIYKINTLSYEIKVNHNEISLHLYDLEISYRRSKKIIENELGKLLEELSKTLKEDRSEYFLNINFKEYNPYFGFFVRRLNSREINSFNVKLNINSDKVTISKNSIEIYTDSLQKLNTISKDYLTLSPR